MSKIGPQMYRYDDLPWLTSVMLVYRAMMESEDVSHQLLEPARETDISVSCIASVLPTNIIVTINEICVT